MNGPRPHSIDLNADLGEGASHDAELMGRITSASISCGAHAGDRATILDTLGLAKAQGVCVGAHPAYADREGFGRREMPATAAEVRRLILDQVRELDGLATAIGLTLRFLKPHGALYNQAQRQPEIAQGVLDAADFLQLPVLGQPGSLLHAEAARRGIRYVTEGFADRRYQPDGRLVPRDRPNALLHDPVEVEAQVLRLIDEGIETLCLHGDDPRVVEHADVLRAIMRRHAITPIGVL